MRGATTFNVFIAGTASFQSTPPHGGRPAIRSANAIRCACFNPRPRTGGDIFDVAQRLSGFRFQSTPPHGGRRALSGAERDEFEVSIHAPARGATWTLVSWSASTCVSIHAPARGATHSTPMGLTPFRLFQSTPPHGGRRWHDHPG